MFGHGRTGGQAGAAAAGHQARGGQSHSGLYIEHCSRGWVSFVSPCVIVDAAKRTALKCICHSWHDG